MGFHKDKCYILPCSPKPNCLSKDEAIAQVEARVEDLHVNCSESPELELLKLWEAVRQVGSAAIAPSHRTPRPRPQDLDLSRLGTRSS